MSRLARFAYLVLVYNILVILGGALVRATGSGAGCGSHWPLCDGEVVPRNPGTETLIEYSHRFKSGLALLLVGALVVLVFRYRPAGSFARRAAAASFALILVEAAIGAGLVLLELVGDDASPARAWWMGGHLVNTFFLLAALTLTAWALDRASLPRLALEGRVALLLGIAFFAMLVTGASGAVTALGDTVFPVESLAEHPDASLSGHFLVRLRFLHPILAVITTGLLLSLPTSVGKRGPRRLGATVTYLALLQLVAGVVNVLLLAPVWMQLVHLLLADALWIALVLFAAEALTGGAAEAEVPSMAEASAA